jgi:hypothetical protein
MDRIVLNLHLLLDDISRSNLKVSISELIMYDVNIITNFRDLTPEFMDKSKKVVILEDYLRKNDTYSDLVLYKELFGLEYIYLGLDDVLLKVMSDVASCYKMDSSIVDYDRLYSVVYSDEALLQKYIEKEIVVSNVEIFAESVVSNPVYDDNVRGLAENYLSLLQVLSDKVDKIDSFKLKVSELMTQLQGGSDYSKELERSYHEMISNAINLNRTLKQYESILSKDVYDKIILSKYVNRPSIIYLKEYEELLHLNSLLSTMAEMFKFQYKKSVKVLRLYDSSRSRRVLTIPKYYEVIQNKFVRRSVIANDFLVKVGNYTRVLDLLLTNHSGLDILIIVDCKDHSDVVLTGTALYLNMCRNIMNLPAYGLDKASTIVNNEKGNSMSWDNYEQYHLMDNQEKFLFLSSRPVMQNIYELNKVFAQVGV